MVRDCGVYLYETDDLDSDSLDELLVGEAGEDAAGDVVGVEVGGAIVFGEDDEGGED